MLESLATLYVHGAEVDWATFDRDYSRRRTVLPPIRSNISGTGLNLNPPVDGRKQDVAPHPLLEQRLALAGKGSFLKPA